MRAFKVILGSMATFLGLIATGLFVSAAMRPEVTSSESRGFKPIVMGSLLMLALFCFGVTALCLTKLRQLPQRFSPYAMFIVITVVAVLLGILVISRNSPAPRQQRQEWPATINGSTAPQPVHRDDILSHRAGHDRLAGPVVDREVKADADSRTLLVSLRDAFKRNRGRFSRGEDGKWSSSN
jgi:hypothetical protein